MWDAPAFEFAQLESSIVPLRILPPYQNLPIFRVHASLSYQSSISIPNLNLYELTCYQKNVCNNMII